MDSDEDDHDHQPAGSSDGLAYAVDREPHNTAIRMTPKIPPTFDGQSSWFEFEDLIDDWLGITTLTAEKLGPSLKNALVGAAEFYKNMLDNTELRNPEHGVRHFKDVLRPYFVKGVNHVFLWRFLQLFRCYRGNQEFVLWIGRFEVTSRRVLTAWMDLFHHDTPGAETPQFVALLPVAAQQVLQNIEDADELRLRLQEAHDEFVNVLRAAHRAQFPLTDNLMSLVFLVQADLNEIQRERFVTSMSLRQIEMNQYTYLQVKQLFMELFCTTRTGIADPTIRHTKRSTFLVSEEGECDGEQGYWVVEEETGEEGFVSLFSEDDFWVLSAKGGYTKKRVFNRRFKPGKGKGRGGKQRKRPGFRPRSNHKGKGYLADDSQFPDDHVFYGKKGKKGGKKGGKKNKDSFKSSKKGKSSKGDASSSTGKANLAGTTPSEEHVDVQDSSATGQDNWSDDNYYWDSTYGVWCYYEQWDTSHDQWNYYVAQEGWNRWTDHHCLEEPTISPFGAMFAILFFMEFLLHRLSRAIGYASTIFAQIRLMLTDVSQHFCSVSQEFIFSSNEDARRHFAELELDRHDGHHDDQEDEVRRNGHAYLNYETNVQHTLLTDYIEMSTHPTYVILDSGCTRAMGSRFAIDRLVRACQNHSYSHLIKFTKEASHNKFSFANGESSHVKEKLVIHLKNPKHPTGWISTSVDILDKGRVPILFSVEQMRNLRMNIEHTPAGEFLTCPVFGLKRYAMSVATSNHPVLDVMFLAMCGHKPSHSFAATPEITCPACNGKHRKHIYDEHCNLKEPQKREKIVPRKPVPLDKSINKPEASTPAPTHRLKTKSQASSKPEQRLDDIKETELETPDLDQPIADEPPAPSSSSKPKKVTKAKPVVVEDDPEVPVSQKKEPKIKADLPLALRRIHQKLESPVELLKLHLKHYHMSSDQFRKRTSALKIPEEIYQNYDLIVKQCETCQGVKKGPSRPKVSGMRSEVFGDLTFIDHAEVQLNHRFKIMFLIIYDGATQLMTSFPCETKSEDETIGYLMDYFDIYQLNPKYIVGDQGFSGQNLEAYYNRKGIRFISLGPQTPWPNRAEAAVRLFKEQVKLTLDGVRADPLCNPFSFRVLLRMACQARNSMVTFGGVTPLELAFGRRPADVIGVDTADPAQLSAEVPSHELAIEATRRVAMKAYLEARQSEDLRRDIASKLQFSDGPFFPGDKIYYWNPAAGKIKPDGSKRSTWIKGKVVSQEGSMVTIDLGTRVIKVNSSKIRKDHQPVEDVDIPLEPVALHSADKTASMYHADTTAVDGCTTTKETDPANKIVHADSLLSGPEGITYGSHNWEPVTQGKIDFLELFSGSARLSQVAAMNGLKVGQPIDLRTGFDLLKVEGRKRAMEVIHRQEPSVVFLAPVCAPWSQMTNINDRDAREEKRRKYMPMVEFCIQVAVYQLRNGRHFIIENPAGSAMWWQHVIKRIIDHPQVCWGTLDMCAFGMKDPNGYYYYKPTSLLHSFPDGTLDPVFKRCPGKNLGGASHIHQPLEGSAPGFGSRTKLAQVYPYRFCSTLIRSLLMFGNLRSLRPSQTLLVTELLSCLTLEELKDVTQDVNKLDQEHVHFSSKTFIPVREHHLRYAMNKMNMLSGKTEYLPTLVNLQDDVGILRQHFVPTNAFEHAVILRGTFLPLRTTYGSKRGVLLLWKKKDVSQMCVLDTHSLDLRHLKPNQWTCVFLWNSNGDMPVNPDIPDEVMIPQPPGLPPPENHPPANPNNDIPMDPDQDMHQPPLVPDEDPQDDNNDAPEDPMVPDDPPHDPHPDNNTPGPDPGSQPPDQPPSQPQFPFPGPYPPGPPSLGTTVPPQPHQPIPHPMQPPSLPLQPLPPDAFIPSLVVPPQVTDTQMQHSIKRESGQPASSPQKKAKAPAPGNQMPAPSGSSSRNHLGGDVPVSISSSSKPKDPKPDDDPDEDETDPQAGPSSGPPILPVDDDDEQPNQNDEKSDTVEYNSAPEGITDSDDTVDYQDLVINDDASWSLLTQEQKICSNTGSFSVPRYIDNSPVDVMHVRSSNFYEDRHWTHRGQKNVRRNYSDITEVYDQLNPEDSAFMTLYQSLDKSSLLVGKKRKEATQQEKRELAKQFLEAKKAECQSWFDNDVFELVDLRKIRVRNFVKGRWVLTVKKDKDGHFLKCKARWVLKGFQDKQKDSQQTDSPAASRSGFRCATQQAANLGWDLYHMDLKTAFLQGEAYDETRDIICEIPKECGYPPHMGARMKKSAYGLNDAPRRWWQVVDKALLSYGLVPTRADRCTYILYGDKKTSSNAIKKNPQQELNLEDALELLMNASVRNNSQGRKPEGFICLHVDDLYMAGSPEFEKRVLSRIRKDFNVGSEDKNDIMFVGQRIKWKKHDKHGDFISCDQKLAVDQLEEIKVDKQMKDNVPCSPSMHTAYRSVLGQLNWLQSRTQCHICYRFSRCASAAASPSIADVREINKTVRTLKSQYIDARFWPIKGPQRIIGMPDASYRNNADKSSQRAHVIFIAEDRKVGRHGQKGEYKVHTRGSVVDYESHKITTTTQSTTVAELNALMKCFGTCLFIRALWADVTGEIVPIHIRTDANNLVTTAQTTHLPEQKETHHLIQMLRHESNTGQLDDLSHIVSEFCLADPLTKSSAKPDQLVRAIETGVMQNVDVHPPFRSLLKHKAFLSQWVADYMHDARQAIAFMAEDISQDMHSIFNSV